MKNLNCIQYFEHIHIIYEGGDVTMKYREYYQTLKLFKKVEAYCDARVVVSSSALFEHEHIIKRDESEYCCMLCNWEFILMAKPDRDNDYGDKCVIVRSTDKQV